MTLGLSMSNGPRSSSFISCYQQKVVKNLLAKFHFHAYFVCLSPPHDSRRPNLLLASLFCCWLAGSKQQTSKEEYKSVGVRLKKQLRKKGLSFDRHVSEVGLEID
jgi:hypothetical protein